MAYIEQKDYKNSLDTYFKAFELSDGTVEVGAGLGHALGLAGEYELAKQMADYYHEAAKTNYLPHMQRAFIHIGIGEYDEAIALLEEAYEQKSWFLIFMAVEPWLDPLREDERFIKLTTKMQYP
jgi:tetratricopeptide (TPR) repeat protein